MEDSDHYEDKPSILSLGVSTVIMIVILVGIPLSFFLLLNTKTNADFGLEQILFSIAFGIIGTIFLIWLKSFMRTRVYFGTIIGLFALAVIEYGIYQRFRGSYTTIYLIVIGLVVIIYLGYFFMRFRKTSSQKAEQFDDTN